MSTSRPVILCIAALLCAVTCAQQPQPATQPLQDDTTDVLATVDGQAITADQLWWYLENTLGGQLLDQMIVRTLVVQAAEEQGLKVGAPEVDEAMAKTIEGHGSQAGFQRWLAQSGQTEKGLRLKLQEDLLLDKLMRVHMGLTEEGIRRFYDSHPDQFSEAPRVYLLDIVSRTVNDAYAARERLAAGEDFATLAREVSVDPTAEAGGDRGWTEPGDVYCEPVKAVVFRMQQGEISDPVDCGDHAHVFLAQEVRPARPIPFEDARDAVIERIEEQRGITEELYISLLKQRADIDVAWSATDYLNGVYADLRAIKVVVDGKRLELATAPMLLPSGNLLIPAQPVLEAMGAEVTWQPEGGVIEAGRDGMELRIVRGVPILGAGGAEIDMREAPRIDGAMLMIPPREPIEALGGSVEWNRAENTLYVTSRAEEDVDEG